MHSIRIVGILLIFCLIRLTQAASPLVGVAASEKSQREVNLEKSRVLDAEHRYDFGGRTNYLVRPGLVADRARRIVRVSAESIALRTGNPVEFQLITSGSGKDYEAQAISFASAEDVHQALEFIGLHAGQCVNPAVFRFWPKGDRVRMTFRCPDPESIRQVRPQPNRRSRPTRSFCELRAEQLVIDKRTGKPLPETGYVFTGSDRASALQPATGVVYVADAYSPGSIVSLYNDPSTVLDVPRKAAQQEVYRLQTPNPDNSLPTNELIEIVLEPFYRDNAVHWVEYSLTVSPDERQEVCYSLGDGAGQTVNTNRTLNGFLATLGRLAERECEVFVTLRPDDALTLKALSTMAQILGELDTDRGIRLEAPPEGHPYFKAFLPNPSYRHREARQAPAAEFFLSTQGGVTTGELVFVETEWKDNSESPVFHETRLPISTPDRLEAAFAAHTNPPRVILIFAPDTMKYGALREFIAPFLKRHMILYVFRDESTRVP